MGRFERGLSSFQQSVAMDRIQRIVGVLQKPQMGERYLGTLLQVEGMLKTWFPHIAAQKTSLGGSRHQLTKHFPSHDSDSVASSPIAPVGKMDQTQLGHVVLKPEQPWHLTEWPAMNLTWIHTTPICNPPLGSPGSAEWRLKSKVMANHLKFIARTVMVQEGNVEGAYRTLNRILTMDGLIEDIKRRRYYEKPCRRRQRESYETCRRIYNREMARKINFLMRKNRADPWQGC
ncbi:circadian-associated transcriptional repressor isoform X5 [Eulemur rufifrons]